jgi:hypothetical protein
VYCAGVKKLFQKKRLEGLSTQKLSAMANNLNESVRWKNSPRLYPVFEEIAEALQDEGKEVKRKVKGQERVVTSFPKIEKLAHKVYQSIVKEFSPDGLTKNATRAKKPLYAALVVNRKHTDVTETHPFFHPFGKSGKVFLVTNSPEHCGLDICIDQFQNHYENLIKQKNSARTGDDGLRLGLIMLESDHRGSVTGVLSKKKDRKKSDINGDPNLHFFEKLLGDWYLNQEYVAPQPKDEYWDQFPEDEKEVWNPNCSSIFENKRDASWLKATWEDYLRPKYKKALDKWNKDTGGGDGNPTEFINFCEGDRWLVWLFCKDLECNFLLASGAAGRMPRHLQAEAGFEEDVSSLGSSGPSSGTKRSINAAEDELDRLAKSRRSLDSAVDMLGKYLDDKKTNATPDRGSCLRQIAEYSEMLVNDRLLETMSPETRAKFMEALRSERKLMVDKVSKPNSS